ncbi:MFS transporter [Corynebacterium sp.]|uniref:MFS transporter n=1 Tax=Corynebacterium sp. TaxID=1720 RepID=UPI003B3A07AD
MTQLSASTAAPVPRTGRLQRVTIYVGGFIGPFSAQSIAVILPDVADTFSISLSQSAVGMSVYLLPFSTMMLVSTHAVRTFRPRTIIRIAYTVTALGALTCTLTSSWMVFLVGLLVMGLANAFTLPVLQLVLRQCVPPDRFGSAMGVYVSMQSLGLLSAPLVSGAATLLNWQLTYLVAVAASLWILVAGVPDAVPPARMASPDGRVRWYPTLVYIATCAVIGFGVFGMSTVTSVHLEERFGTDAAGRGIVIMCGGLAAFLFSSLLGRLADAVGPTRVLLGSMATAALVLVLIPLAPAPWAIAVCWALAVLCAQGVQLSVNLRILRAPGGASLLSTVQAFRFFASSFTPLVLFPVYGWSSTWAFWIPALAAVVVLGAQAALALRPVPPRSALIPR